MSYTITVRGSSLAGAAELARLLRERDIECVEIVPGVLIASRPATGLRAVRIEYAAGDTVEVRMSAFSASADYATALEAVEELLRSPGARFQSQDAQGWFPAEELRHVHTEEWVRSEAAGSFAMLAAACAEEGGVSALEGIRRGFIVGPRLLEQWPPALRAERLRAAFHRLQHLEREGALAPKTTLVFDDGPPVTAAEWDPLQSTVIDDGNQILGGQDYVRLHAPDLDADPITFPAEQLVFVAGTRLERLDEARVVVPPIPKAELSACCERARAVAYTKEQIERKARHRRKTARGIGVAQGLFLIAFPRTEARCRVWGAFALLAASLLFFTHGIPAIGGESGYSRSSLVMSAILTLFGLVQFVRARAIARSETPR